MYIYKGYNKYNNAEHGRKKTQTKIKLERNTQRTFGCVGALSRRTAFIRGTNAKR
jgi:hypothetical protein